MTPTGTATLDRLDDGRLQLSLTITTDPDRLAVETLEAARQVAAQLRSPDADAFIEAAITATRARR